jgi:hypothetical protein
VALHDAGVNASRVWITCSGEVGIDIDTTGGGNGSPRTRTSIRTSTEGGIIPWSRFQIYWAKASKAIHEQSNVLVTVGFGVVKHNCDTWAGSQGNKASDPTLRAIIDDPDVHIDFYSPHYYPWMDPYWPIPMYVTPSAYGIDTGKPCLVGECPATASTGHTLTADYTNAYSHGWQGVMPWTSNGADSNGGFAELTPATIAFNSTHPELVFP